MKRLNVLQSLVVFFLFSQISWGAVPQLINFQGVLRDSSGNPVADGSYSVTFTVYDAASGGNNLWTETQSVNTTRGIFAVLLGSTNPVPDTAFKGSELWLGVAVSPDPEMPRQRLVSVGYAFRVAHFIPDLGELNTFIGPNAGNLTMSGSTNTASGAYALQNNTTGLQNTASGALALLSNTTGVQNTAIGAFALQINTTGVTNTASGHSALQSNTVGNFNTANGAGALIDNTSGWSNTASGQGALFNNTTGDSNTASGRRALLSNTTGSNNTAIGNGADVSTGNLTNATAIGANAVVSASNSLVLGGTGANAVNVGIGTTSPASSALLELSSTFKGLLLPRMTKAERDAIFSPVAGLMIYQTDNTPGLRVYNGTNWMRFTETAD